MDVDIRVQTVNQWISKKRNLKIKFWACEYFHTLLCMCICENSLHYTKTVLTATLSLKKHALHIRFVQVIAGFVVIFGINTTSDILKLLYVIHEPLGR